MVKNISIVLKMVDKYHDDIESVYFYDKTDNSCHCKITFRFGIPYAIPTAESRAMIEIINRFIRETGAVLYPDSTCECVQIGLLVKL